VRIIPPISAALLLLSLLGVLGYGAFYLAIPAADWIEKAPYSLQQLRWKLLPLKKPMEKVAEASGEIEKLTAPNDPKAKPAIEVKRHPITDILVVRTPEFLTSIVLFFILLYFLLANDGVFLNKMIKLLPAFSDRKRAVSIASEIEGQVSRYLLTVTLINLGLGLAVGTIVGLLWLA
jgi:predicted PurR-regulated permease PerM